MAYFALKMAGIPADDARLKRRASERWPWVASGSADNFRQAQPEPVRAVPPPDCRTGRGRRRSCGRAGRAGCPCRWRSFSLQPGAAGPGRVYAPGVVPVPSAGRCDWLDWFGLVAESVTSGTRWAGWARWRSQSGGTGCSSACAIAMSWGLRFHYLLYSIFGFDLLGLSPDHPDRAGPRRSLERLIEDGMGNSGYAVPPDGLGYRDGGRRAGNGPRRKPATQAGAVERCWQTSAGTAAGRLSTRIGTPPAPR